MQELLVTCVEFLDLGMVWIEVEHPGPGLDNLIARLEEQRSSNWDIPALQGALQKLSTSRRALWSYKTLMSRSTLPEY